jgi:peptide/nickel transport system permease protein
MAGIFVERFFQTVIVLFGVLVITFTLVHLIPGDPAQVILGTDSTPEELERLRHLLELDQPLTNQFVNYMGRVVRGDFGNSIFQHEPVMELILERLPATIELTIAALLIATVIGIIAGIISGTRPNSFFDGASSVIALAGVAMPVFWLGMLAILLFSLTLNWLPSFGRGEGIIPSLIEFLSSGNAAPLQNSIRHLILPAFVLGAFSTAIIARLVRSSMLEVMSLDYVRTARAKGLRERSVIIRHALRNAFIPVVTVLGLQMGVLLGGAVIAETIFAWPGIGRLLIGAINQRDYPLVQALVIVIALMVCIVNLGVDLMYVWLNPRTRTS